MSEAIAKVKSQQEEEMKKELEQQNHDAKKDREILSEAIDKQLKDSEISMKSAQDAATEKKQLYDQSCQEKERLEKELADSQVQLQ